MKLIFLTALMAAAAVIAPAADTSLTGEWQIQRSAAGNASKQTCTFTQSNSELTGNCSTDGGPVPLSGKVEGTNVTWTYKADSQGGPVTVVYKGTIDSDTKMSGTVSAIEFNVDGEFSGTRSK